ncbi:hypothetical protein Ndes2526B_g03747 [Nannochloris sp. 'desiccata']|nr:hypothetical protein NADE_006666 [Chlorella desiccata (nom. nud.)]
MAYLAVESQAPSLYCRICWDTCESESLISPCSCKGTQKYVHVKCLRKWQENVQKRDLRDERAFRCGVCQVRYTLPPPDPHFTTKLFQILRGLGGAICISLLAFGLAGPPWPHLALLALVLLGSRSHGMLAFALLASGTMLAALHAKGLRLVMRFDDMGSPFGFAVVQHGAPVPGLGPGTLLVANSDLNHSIFRRSVVLIYQHDNDGGGARGVILTQPMSASSSSSFSGNGAGAGGSGSRASPRGSVLRPHFNKNPGVHMHNDNNNIEDGDDVVHDLKTVENEAERRPPKPVYPAASVSGPSSPSLNDIAVQHRLGGPVGMPGEGVRQEIAIVHSVAGIEGATVVILGGGNSPPVYIGGRLTDVLEIGKEMCNDAINPEKMKNHNINNNGDISSGRDGGGGGVGFGNMVANRFKRSGISSRFPTPNQVKQQNNVNMEEEEQEEDGRVVSCDGGPSVLVFHGISTWAKGQLEGEIRAGAWAYGDASFENIMEDNPGDLWRSLMRSDRVGLLV